VTWPLSFWTTIMLVSLLALGWRAKSPPALVGIVAANYFGSAWLRQGDDIMLVGFFDAWCASMIVVVFPSARANIVAGLFLLMMPIYAFGWLIGASVHATFALVEILGWLQIAVVGNVDKGIRVLGRMGRGDSGQSAHRTLSYRVGDPVSPGHAARPDGPFEADVR
jgi:hypothetical protein